MILAFSKHRRNNFKEFRKAAICSDIPEIQKLATAPASWERRENYSMGGGYYLAEDGYCGWQIRKIPVDTMDHLIRFYGDAGKPEISASNNLIPSIPKQERNNGSL